jgi:RNA polymerase sigma-32 factor
VDRSIQMPVANAVSATERIPGATFRATVARFVEENPGLSREALARDLRERLAALGIDYHLRTLKRQISGAVATVPPEVLATLRVIVTESVGSGGALGNGEQSAALDAFYMTDSNEDTQPIYVARERVLPFAELWLYLHPDQSKRALAMRLRAELEAFDIRLNIDSLQSILAGKQQLVRREIKSALLTMLQRDGIENAEQAEARWQQMSNEIRTSHEGRFFENARKIHDVAHEWKVFHKEPSSRKLAMKLRQRLAERGIAIGLPHIQKLVDGRAHRIRHGVALVIEDILREEMAAKPSAIMAPTDGATNELDLAWVQAEPIAKMAQHYVTNKAGMTMRKLSIQLSHVVERYGYATSPNTIQPILGGHKKKTRGFIYRAMLEIEGQQQALAVPHAHVIGYAARRDRETRTQSSASSDTPTASDPQPQVRHQPSTVSSTVPSTVSSTVPSTVPRVALTNEAAGPASASRSTLAVYRSAISQYRVLDRATEQELAWRYRRDGDQGAARALVESHLQFVVKVAAQYRGYGMQLSDLVEEGNLGLLEAVRRFEPERNLRFKTYAIYWIRAFVVEHLLREWSIVGGGSGALVSRTFFRLRRERSRLESQLGEHDSSINGTLAKRFHTSEEAIQTMTQRVGSRDMSLDVSPGGEGPTMLEMLSDPLSDPEVQTEQAQRNALVRSVVNDAMESLDSRERLIVKTRLFADDELSLADLGRRLGVSRERVRQLEERTKSKLRNAFAAVTNRSFDFGSEALVA